MSPRKVAIGVGPKTTGRGTALTAAWAHITRAVFKEVNGDMPGTKVAAIAGLGGMPTNGVMLIAGASGTMATRTGGGEREE